jgi:alpha-galactosidase
MGNAAQRKLNRRSVLKSGLLLATGLACGPLGLSETASDGEKSWSIGNDLIRRDIVFRPQTGLFTRQLSGLAVHAELVQAAAKPEERGQEFSFVCNGKRCAGTNGTFDLVGAAESALPGGKSLAIKLRHKEFALEVSVVYAVYDGHPAVRKHLALRNTGAETLHLAHMNIEALAVTLGPANEVTLLTQYGAVPRETFYTGRSEDACLMLANGRTGKGLAIVSEVPGYMKRTEIGGWDGIESTPIGVMYDTDLMPFERALAPGETFATACASLLAFHRGDGFNDPRWVLPSYTAQVLMRRVDKKGAPWIYNTWEPFERGINHKIALELIDAAGAMGMDIFTIDDGWQQDYGANAVNLSAFPEGLQPILDAVEAKGMRLGLWIPIAAIATTTQAYREHPEWASLTQDGKLKTTGTMAGEMAVMCMASDYRDSAAARIVDAIDRFKLAYVKLDLTTIFNAYGEAPGCYARGHRHGNWAESLNAIYEGISYVTSKVYEKHPEVLLDLTFELWGQKHIIDAGLLAAGDLDWMSNVDDQQTDSAGTLQARQLLYARSPSMPVESMLIGNLHANMPNVQEAFATAIGSAPLLLGDLRKLTIEERAWYREKIGWYKKLRGAARISESFIPLGSWLQTTPAAWDGFARLDRGGNGLVALFRNKSDAAEVMVELPLLPEGRYKAHSVTKDRDLGIFDHAAWARGVRVKFANPEGVEVIELSAVKG